ncbi:hypothetical protein ACLOJK_028516 [Asimina triloba]
MIGWRGSRGLKNRASHGLKRCWSRTRKKTETKRKNGNKKEKENDIFIPHHLFVDHILPRLPLDSLIMCKFVCKQWNSSISDPCFMDLYNKLHANEKRRRYILIAAAYPKKKGISVGTVEEERSGGKKIMNWLFSLPLISTLSWGISTSSHGLVCVFDSSGQAYVCNPAIGEHISLPKSSSNTTTSLPIISLGFDPERRLYKVICLWAKESGIECEILTLGDDDHTSWRRIGHVPYILQSSPPAFIQSNLYWMCFQDSGRNKAIGLVALDVTTEEFRKLDCMNSDEHLMMEGFRWLGVMSSGWELYTVEITECYGWIRICALEMNMNMSYDGAASAKMITHPITLYSINGRDICKQPIRILHFSEEAESFIHISMGGKLFCQNDAMGLASKVELPIGERIRYELCMYLRSPISVKWRSTE